jgi:hypothetical protein
MADLAGGEGPESLPALTTALLRSPVRDDDQPPRPFSYPRPIRLVVSVLIAFHVLALVVYNAADRGPIKGFHWLFDKYARLPLYMETIGHTQDWGMFSPHPPQENVSTRVLVVTKEGRRVDMLAHPGGWREYPSLVYDPRVKVNERITQAEQIRMSFAAAVCRSWEESHGGEPAQSVSLLTQVTQIPAPDVAVRTGGYHPMGLDVSEIARTDVRCDGVPHGRLPNSLRARHGLPPRPGSER